MMKKYLRIVLIFVIAVSLELTGCTATKTTIAYTVYPIGFLIDSIAGDLMPSASIQEDEIIQRAQIRDDYQEVLDSAAAFFYVGQMEPYMTVYGSQIKSLCEDAEDLSILNAIYNFQRYTQVVADGTVTFVEGPYYNDKSFDTIDCDEKDLYLWTDPIAMLSMAKDIRDWLCENYPDEKTVFEENFSKLETELIILDAQYQELATDNIENNKTIRFVSMTASFGNWQKTYGFEVYPLILSKYGVLPNEQQLEVIKERIKADHVHYIVYEANMTDDMLALFNELEEELGLTRVELSNLSSLTDEEKADGKDYLSIMYENLQVLETMAEDSSTAAYEETVQDTAEEETAAEETAEESGTEDEEAEENTDSDESAEETTEENAEDKIG